MTRKLIIVKLSKILRKTLVKMSEQRKKLILKSYSTYFSYKL